MKRLLLVSQRSLDLTGGTTARWRAFRRYLPEHGWDIDILCAPYGFGAAESAERPRGRRRATRRARVMSAVGRMGTPAFALAAVRPEAVPLSMAWVPRGALAVRRRLRARPYDVVLATGPPMAGPLAARLGLGPNGPPFVVELRDLWAGSPAFDLGGDLLDTIERWLVRPVSALIACTPEAAGDLAQRHPGIPVHEVPNGFEPELLRWRDTKPRPRDDRLTILHSGALTADRPLSPLLRVLAGEPYRLRFRLVLNGFLAPAILAEIAADSACEIEVQPPTAWHDAVRETAAAHVGLVSQGKGAGDATAVAAKVYEYMALGKPVLCITDGGATEALVRRLGGGELCARLDDEESIRRCLDRLMLGSLPPAVPAQLLEPYSRRAIARRMAEVLERCAANGAVRG